MAQKFERFYTLSEMGFTSDVSATAGKENLLAELTVPAQTLLTFGAGAIANGVDFRRVVTIDLKDGSGSAVDGKVRFELANATLTKKAVVGEERTEELRAGTVKLGEFPTKAKEDSKLRIIFIPDSTVTVSASNSSGRIPTTAYI